MRPRVARIEAFGLEAPLRDGGYGASMVRLPARIATLVKITTSDGVAGWGECFGPPRVLAWGSRWTRTPCAATNSPAAIWTARDQPDFSSRP